MAAAVSGTLPDVIPPHARSATLTSRMARAELRSAVLDGELVAIGEGFVCIDEPVGPHDRAEALAIDLADSRAIVCDGSAAWVWGWGMNPAVLETCVPITARVASPERRRRRSREAVIEQHEVIEIGGVRVTSPLRTIIDLVRHDDDEHVTDLVVAALEARDVTALDVLTELRRRAGISHLRRARARVELAISRC